MLLPKVRAGLNCVDVVDSDAVSAVSQHHATKNPFVCYNCNSLNHIAKKCSFAKNLSPKKIFQSFKCGNKRHIAFKYLKLHGSECRGKKFSLPRS